MTDAYEAIVYDLDGTLVSLDVDWDGAAGDVATALRLRGVDVDDGTDLWALLDRGEAEGFGPVVKERIAEHEREGARTSTRLALADELPVEVSAAVCSLNCEAACRIALELHGLDGYVDAIVGRDTVENHKPHPEPLLHAIGTLGASPDRTLFVGDSDSDAVAADRAGVDFQYVSDRLA